MIDSNRATHSPADAHGPSELPMLGLCLHGSAHVVENRRHDTLRFTSRVSCRSISHGRSFGVCRGAFRRGGPRLNGLGQAERRSR